MADDQILSMIDDAPLMADDRELLYQPANDTGNAKRLIARHGHDLRFVPGQGWLMWDGKRFAGGDAGEAKAMIAAQATAHAIAGEARMIAPEIERLRAAGSEDKDAAERIAHLEERAEKHAKFAVVSGNAQRVRGMLDMASPHQRTPAQNLDADPFRFNVQNGTLVLAARDDAYDSAALLPHTRKDLITKLAGAAYDPDASCPLFLKFLERILPDESLRRFMRAWFGYCLSGSIREQKFVICYGTGANGKSVLLSVVKHVLGEYATTVPMETFLSNDKRRGSDATPDVARLPGARLVTASEPEIGSRLSESMIKTVTGEEAMTARQLFRQQFEFMPSFKLMLSVNIKPSVRGVDEGIWRRIALVPFETFIPVEERDRGLADKLKAEAAGVLNWMIEGFLEWQESGLPETPRIAEAVAEYRIESDQVGEFMRQRTRRTPGWRVRARDLHSAYVAWTEANFGDRRSAVNSNAFGRRLGNLGYHRLRSAGSFYMDLELLPDPEAGEGDGE